MPVEEHDYHGGREVVAGRKAEEKHEADARPSDVPPVPEAVLRHVEEIESEYKKLLDDLYEFVAEEMLIKDPWNLPRWTPELGKQTGLDIKEYGLLKGTFVVLRNRLSGGIDTVCVYEVSNGSSIKKAVQAFKERVQYTREVLIQIKKYREALKTLVAITKQYPAIFDKNAAKENQAAREIQAEYQRVEKLLKDLIEYAFVPAPRNNLSLKEITKAISELSSKASQVEMVQS